LRRRREGEGRSEGASIDRDQERRGEAAAPTLAGEVNEIVEDRQPAIAVRPPTA
jgi:hypothetical protein